MTSGTLNGSTENGSTENGNSQSGVVAFPAWAKPVHECVAEYEADLQSGLSSAEARRRLEKFGFNELEKQAGHPLWKLVLEQFDDMLVKILLAAAAISFVLAYAENHDGSAAAFVEPLVILTILVINAVVGVWQESNAERALEAL